jgi:hypothetical protein
MMLILSRQQGLRYYKNIYIFETSRNCVTAACERSQELRVITTDFECLASWQLEI